jgi:DNA-directed RNA polymerase sigma subunit (sigma70/sigma32)
LLFKIVQRFKSAQSERSSPQDELGPHAASATSAIDALQAQRAHRLLIVFNTRLVLHFVARFPRVHKDITAEELVIEGMQGLHHAVGSFDMSRGVRLSGLASKWIECEIRASLRRRRRAFGMPASFESVFVAVCRARQCLVSENPSKYASPDEASSKDLLVSFLSASLWV